MSQDFYMKVPTVDISGNNGSISGDEAAAMRYIECRMTKYGNELLGDLHKNAVNWKPNYDGSQMEPETLPAKYPNLLINGGFGIGQAYTSSIPAHNVNDILDTTIALIKNPNIPIDEIASKIRPDYPTGGVIINNKELTNAYKTGVGNVKLRAKVTIDKNDNLVITEIPYMTTVGNILNKIQEVCKDGRIDGIADIVDQTNEKNGVKVIIKTKRGVDPNVIEQQLYQLTPLQSTMTFSLIAVDGNTFKTYNILELFTTWIEYRKTTLKRIFNYDMSKIRRRIHVIEGLLICLNDIDKVVAMIKKSKDRKDTIEKLKKNYSLTDIQAEAIADLPLYRLSSMSIQNLKDEKDNLEDQLSDLSEYFIDANKLNKYIIAQLEEGKKKYGSERKTMCVDVTSQDVVEELVPDTDHTIFLTKDGFIKKLTLDMSSNSLGCKGRSIGKMREKDVILSAVNVNNKDNLFIFTDQGRMFRLRVYDIREVNSTALGTQINTYISLKPKENAICMMTFDKSMIEDENAYLLFVTKKGFTKRTMLNNFTNSTAKTGLISIKLTEEDTLVGVKCANDDRDVVIATEKGLATRYSVDEISILARTTIGNKCCNLDNDDSIIGFDTVDEHNTHIFAIDSKGNGKLVEIPSLHTQARTTKCKPLAKLGDAETKLVSVKLVHSGQAINLVTTSNMVKVNVDDVPVLLRSAKSKSIIKTLKDERVVECYIEELENNEE